MTATDADELETVTSTGKVSVTAVSPDDQVMLSVSATSDRDTVYSLPGTVKFTVTVTNEGANEVKDVYVSASGVQLYHFPTIAAGRAAISAGTCRFPWPDSISLPPPAKIFCRRT